MDALKQRVKGEVLLALELAALAAFAFSRPVLDSFGRSPETFIAQGATGSDIVLFGLGVAVVPALAVLVVGVLVLLVVRLVRWVADGNTGPVAVREAACFAAPRLRSALHVLLVGLLAGIGAWRMGYDQTGWSGTARKLFLLGLAVALLAGFLRWWPRSRDTAATFLRYAAAAVLVFPLLFLTGSPSGELALGRGTSLDPEVAEAVSDALGEDPPSVLYVVFDALPTMSLLDGEGRIDAETFPNFAALADDATWYQNHTAVSGFTGMSVPAMLTGLYPEPGTYGDAQARDNLLTLLGDSYELHVQEQFTRLCPAHLCRPPISASVGSYLRDAADWWVGGVLETPDERQFDLGGVVSEDRVEEADEWIDSWGPGRGDRPDLSFFHVVIPHEAWEFTNEGELYRIPSGRPTGTMWGYLWSAAGVDLAEQRHMQMVQLADRMLGQLLDALQDAGTYDDTLVVVTADHGAGFTSGGAQRHMHEVNQDWIGWVPLLVKEPGQAEGSVNVDNVEAVDVLPTIAEVLGVEVPWEVDGFPLDRAGAERDPYLKTYAPHAQETHLAENADEDGYFKLDWRDHLDTVLAYEPPTWPGPDGPWKLTEHGDLFGHPVDELDLGPPAPGTVTVTWPSGYDKIDTSRPLPLEVVAGTDIEEGAVVAFALNGTVGSVGRVQADHVQEGVDGHLVQGLLPPWLFADGDNELTAYLVEGPPGDETLHPLTVR